MGTEGKFPKASNVDVHRIITTLFNVKLDHFMAHFDERKPSFEVMRTGGLTEIRVRNDNAFAAYAFFLKSFRGAFSKSVNWSYPLDTFLSELDSLMKYYVTVFNLVESNCVRDNKRCILAEQLMAPLSSLFIL